MKKKIPSINLTRRKTKKGYSYGVSYRYAGEHYRYVVGTKQEAERERARLIRQFDEGRFGLDSINPISLENLIADYAETKLHHFAESSIKRYNNYAQPFLKYITKYFSLAAKDVSLMKSNYIQKFLNEVLGSNDFTEKPWAKKTANSCRKYLIGLFVHGIKIKACKENPVTGIEPFKIIEKPRVKFYSLDELKIIFEKLNDHWRPFFRFLLFTGLRNAEIRTLRWSNVHLDVPHPFMEITSNEDITTKNRKVKILRLNEHAIEILQKQVRKNETYVFYTPKSYKMISKNVPLHIIKGILKKVGLKGNVHKFRHSFASHLAMQGVNFNALAELLGHSDQDSVKIYAHLSPAHLHSEVKKLDNLKID
ncbi:MAG: site-specific integrase [Bacteroidetes bacterium]|nr:site-specific integrase [Bacteroidota bacterium]